MSESYVDEVLRSSFEKEAELTSAESEETATLKEPFGELSNQEILENIGENAYGKMTYKGKEVGHDVDSEISTESKNPVENRVIAKKFENTNSKIENAEKQSSKNTSAINEIQKSIYPQKNIILSCNNDGVGLEVDANQNCVLYQYKDSNNEIPVGTKIEKVEFLFGEKWIDIRSMAELDRVSYSLNVYKVLSWDDYSLNIFALWNPDNEIARQLLSYNIEKIKITYALPKASFYVDDTLYYYEYADLNSQIQLPEVPEKDGFTFDGWCVEGTTEKAEFPYEVNGSDVNFVAAFKATPYKATFYVDGMEFDTVNYISGDSISTDIPTKTGYEFAGWNPEIPDTMPAEDTVFDATWEAKTFDAVFMVDGEVYKTVSTLFGEQISIPLPPAKTGYTFENWSPTPNIMNAEGKVFEATWKIKQINVYFMDGDSVIQTVTANYNSNVEPIQSPTKENYTFNSWKDNDGKDVVFPLTVGENDVYLYASWVRNTITVGFHKTFSNSYDYLDFVTYNCGDPIIPPEFPVEDGFVFIGWCDASIINPDNIYQFAEAFYEINRIPQIAPNLSGAEYYPLYFKGGYIKAEPGYNETDNVWGYNPVQSLYSIFVGGEGSLNRSTENKTPWEDLAGDGTFRAWHTIIGDGITELATIPFATQQMYLPYTLKKILPSVFTESVPDIYYEGTEDEWAQIEIGENNPGISNVKIYFNQPKIII
jgi:uncharacterized repeat protein (TIGR02543 family)